MQGGIDAGKHALCCGLFITSRAIDLPRKEQATNRAGLKAGFQGARVKVIVLNRVAWAQYVHVLQTLHRANQLVLNVKRQAGADAIGVILVGGQAFGL